MDYYIVICSVYSSIQSAAHSSVGTSFSQLVLHLFIMNTGAMTLKIACEKLFQQYRVPNSFDPDQARHFVGPDLGQNCLQRFSAHNTSRQLT